MKYGLLGIVIAACVISNAVLANDNTAVTNGNNQGVGSLRQALETGSSVIRVDPSVSTIFITDTLTYSRRDSLRLLGTGQTIDGSALAADSDILSVTQGADVTISQLSLLGNSDGFNPDPAAPKGGKGIYLRVPENREGLVSMRLRDVSVSRVGNHGVHVSDCSLGDGCGAGNDSAGGGSSASIYVTLDNVLINRVGFGKADADGVRVDDRGEGSIYLSVRDSKFINVGADGIELDEGGNGDVIVDVKNSVFDGNGEYCRLVSFVAGSPCDDDGAPDLDDGFDIDEANQGSIYARIKDTKVINNFDEGLDFDEQGDHGIQLILNNVYAADNQDEAIKLSEEDGGGITAFVQRLTTVDNNGDREGVEIEEAGKGDVGVTVMDSNLIGGEDEELKIEQGGSGKGMLKIRRSNIEALDLDNVDQI